MRCNRLSSIDRRLQVWHDALAGGDLKGPESWSIIDGSVQGAYMHDGRFYVFKVSAYQHMARDALVKIKLFYVDYLWDGGVSPRTPEMP